MKKNRIFDAVLNGDNEGIGKLIEKALAEETAKIEKMGYANAEIL